MPFIQKTISIVMGSLFMAIGVNVFLIHNHLLDGGTFGIGLILHYLIDVQVGLVAFIISIPVFVFAWFHNRSFFYNSLHGMLFSSFIIDLSYHPLRKLGDSFDQDPMISAVVGGILVGSGIGTMLRFDTSIGGTDLLAQIIANYANINPGVVIFLVDLCVVSVGSLIIPGGSIVLSIITVTFVGTTTSLLSMKRIKYKGKVNSLEVL